jgi:hypothetical protein
MKAVLTLLCSLSWLCAVPAQAETILFVGNSYTFGAASPVWKYRADSVTDLNGDGVGGVPALFKAFAVQRGLDYDVSLATAGGKDLRWHWEHRRVALDRAWDHVVLQDYSAAWKARPGDPAALMLFSGRFAALFRARNPGVRLYLTATWSRPDQIYPASGAWHGTPIAAQGLSLWAEADAAASASGMTVLPVGQAFNHAIATGFADPNPYDGIAFGQVSLWAWGHYHGSTYGYYLEALIVFGRVTGTDPRLLGRDEQAGQDLGLSRDQAEALQRIAHEVLAAEER